MQEIEKKSYICPHCQKRQTKFIEWQTTSIAWEHDIAIGEAEEFDNISEHESYECPKCSGKLSYNILKNFI